MRRLLPLFVWIFIFGLWVLLEKKRERVCCSYSVHSDSRATVSLAWHSRPLCLYRESSYILYLTDLRDSNSNSNFKFFSFHGLLPADLVAQSVEQRWSNPKVVGAGCRGAGCWVAGVCRKHRGARVYGKQGVLGYVENTVPGFIVFVFHRPRHHAPWLFHQTETLKVKWRLFGTNLRVFCSLLFVKCHCNLFIHRATRDLHDINWNTGIWCAFQIEWDFKMSILSRGENRSIRRKILASKLNPRATQPGSRGSRLTCLRHLFRANRWLVFGTYCP